MMKLAVVTSHPIQYQVPLFRKLATAVDLTVYFCSSLGMDGSVDQGFGVSVAWDRPLLEGYRHHFLQNYSPLLSPMKFFSFVNPSIMGELKKNRYDAVFVHGYGNATSWFAFAAAIGLRIPILLHGETVFHEGWKPSRKSLKRTVLSRLFKRVSAFLAVGTRSREFYEAFAVPKHKIFLAPYSVDNDFFISEAARLHPQKMELRKTIGIRNDYPVALYASKMVERKRPSDLLAAFEKVSDKANLLFVGDGGMRAALEAEVQSKKLSNVYFAGFRNQTELPRYYAASDIFILPSSFETWGLALNEAMCFSLPIITTTGVGASADLVRPGENGCLYEPGDLSALGRHLDDLIHGPKRREAMGAASLNIISSWNYGKALDGIKAALASLSLKRD